MADVSELYQELILDHNKRPRNYRRIEEPDRKREGYNPLCGDRVTVFLKFEGDVIKEITFEGSGCAISTASASLMTESMRGKTLAEGRELFRRFRAFVTENSADGKPAPNLGKLEAFSGIRRYPARVKCATLAWHTVNAALENHNDVVSTE